MIWLLATSLTVAGWIPARWNSADPETIGIVRQTPVNCLLLERRHWSAGFSTAAAGHGIVTVGLVRHTDNLEGLAEAASAAKLAGLVFEDFKSGLPPSPGLATSGLKVIEMGPRTRMNLEPGAAVAATNQGVWAGINPVDEGSAKAAPSGGPWIDTNTGFLRFVRAVTASPVWIGNRPPEGGVVPAARYLQAVGDAWMMGARWVVALDSDLDKRLLAGEAGAVTAWKEIGAHIAFYESHPEWRNYRAFSQLALVQEVSSGGLISGGILDMIGVKHTPVRAVPARQLGEGKAMAGATMAVNVDPESLTPEQKKILRDFTRAGGTLLTAPPGWKFPAQRDDQITLDKDAVEKIDQMWKEVQNMTGRRNLGARLFNVSTVLSNLSAPEAGKPLVLHMVNYSDYPVEDVTVHVLGKFRKATLLEPGAAPRGIEVYDNEEGTGADISRMSTVAVLILE
jgi:hypothetical protein